HKDSALINNNIASFQKRSRRWNENVGFAARKLFYPGKNSGHLVLAAGTNHIAKHQFMAYYYGNIAWSELIVNKLAYVFRNTYLYTKFFKCTFKVGELLN